MLGLRNSGATSAIPQAFSFFRRTPVARRRLTLSCPHSPDQGRVPAGCTAHSTSQRRQVVCQAKKKKSPETPGEREEPWTGAVTFCPVANQSTYCFVTSLERLGLADLSSTSSQARAKEWISEQQSYLVDAERVLEKEDTEDWRNAAVTPVFVRMDVVRSGRDLVAEGRVTTVFSLQCTRCLAPTTHDVDTPFHLLLSATPVEEPVMKNMGVVLGSKSWDGEDEIDANTGLLDLDLDDKIHFPASQASVDLSKYFRDTVHLELPLKLLCANECKGMCFSCGANLNRGVCTCEEEESDVGLDTSRATSRGKGTLADQLRQQLKKKERGW